MTTHTFDRFDDSYELPEPGDCYRTERTVYRVLDIRPVESQVWHDRWRIRLERVCARSDWDGTGFQEGARFHEVFSYRKGETPQDFARRMGFEEPRNPAREASRP